MTLQQKKSKKFAQDLKEFEEYKKALSQEVPEDSDLYKELVRKKAEELDL